jgi:outer membrane immunogenic protein
LKKFFLASASVLIAAMTISATRAADIAPAPYYKAAPIVVYNWTGFYLGANVGGAWSTGDAHWAISPTTHVDPIIQNLKDSSIAGGVQLGYNFQFMPNWVAGLEADWMWTGNKVNQTRFMTVGGNVLLADSVTMGRNIDWLSTVRGRIGYTVTPQTLLYATGGVTFGQIKYDAIAAIPGDPYLAVTSFDKIKTGYTLGGGLEWAMTANWLLRGEYLFYHFGGESTIVPVVTAPAVPSAFSWDETNLHTVRAALSYKFGN